MSKTFLLNLPTIIGYPKGLFLLSSIVNVIMYYTMTEICNIDTCKI